MPSSASLLASTFTSTSASGTGSVSGTGSTWQCGQSLLSSRSSFSTLISVSCIISLNAIAHLLHRVHHPSFLFDHFHLDQLRLLLNIVPFCHPFPNPEHFFLVHIIDCFYSLLNINSFASFLTVFRFKCILLLVFLLFTSLIVFIRFLILYHLSIVDLIYVWSLVFPF